MKSHFLFLRAGLALLFALIAQTASGQFYFLSKAQAFTQTSAAGPVPDPSGAFTFGADASPAVTLTLPTGGTAPLTQTEDGYGIEAAFSTKAALDAAYPIGTYQMTGTGIPALS